MGIKFFGQYLLEKGIISPKQLLEAVEYQKEINVSLGTLALEKGLLTSEQIKKIHDEQKRQDKKFGEIAVSLGYLTESQLEDLLNLQKSQRLYLGEALVRKGFITLKQLEEELRLYKQEQEREEEEVFKMFKKLPDDEIIEAYVDLTIKMFLRLVREIVKIGGCISEKTAFNPLDWTIEQKAKGDKNFSYLLNLSNDTLLKISEKMSNKKREKIDEITLDIVGEFVNIISGNALSKLSSKGKNFEPEPPISYDSKSSPYKIKENSNIVIIPLLMPEGKSQICLEFY
jgi:hypothetical protein